MGDEVEFERDFNGGEEFGQDEEAARSVAPVVELLLTLDDRSAKLVAPSLRVEELKDDAAACVEPYRGGYSSGSACSSVYGTDDECPVSGDASDQDGSGRRTSEEAGADFEVPSEELKKKIVEQVEFFFSNENIVHDAFMLKHVRRNKMGYVSLKLVTSFRKVKSLTRDFRVVAYCHRNSQKLEVNEEGTKIRRREPLPDYDETTPSRTIVAVNMPFQNPSVEDVAEQFSKFGEIELIRILRPGKQVPQDVKKHLAKHPDLANTICAVIEYEKHESAKVACEQMNDGSGDPKKGVKVILLAAPKKEQKKNNKEEGKSATETLQPKGGKKKRVVDKIAVLNDSTSKEDQKKAAIKNDEQGGTAVYGRSLTPLQDPNRLSPGGSPRTTPRSSPKSSPRSSPRASPSSIRRRSAHGPSPLAVELATTANLESHSRSNHESPSQSPWVQRRLKAKENSLGANSPGTSPMLMRRALECGTEGLKSLDAFGILRQPKGPDGTRGFQLSRTNVSMI